MEPGPTAEPRRLNTSLLRLLNVECTLGGGTKSLGLNWNRRDMYIRNGMLIYVKSKRVARHVNYKGKKNCQFEDRNYLDLNENTCFQAFRPCKTQTNLLSYRD